MDSVSASAWGTTAAERLAQRLEQDIRQRGLQPGDRYMTAEATGKAFNVSRAATNRAMALMAERRLLVRHRKQGSFVGPGLKRSAALGTPTVYILTTGGMPEAFKTMLASLWRGVPLEQKRVVIPTTLCALGRS
jgi:DNA-binding transcriptional MocR family regulator